MTPLIIGEAPNRGHHLEPLSGRSGRRLAALCGATMPEFLVAFERVNLLACCPESWPTADARAAMARLIERGKLLDRPVVLLGRRVASSLPAGALLTLARDFPPLSWTTGHRFAVACCPHPSGRCRWWNDAANVERARAFWTRLYRYAVAPGKEDRNSAA